VRIWWQRTNCSRWRWRVRSVSRRHAAMVRHAWLRRWRSPSVSTAPRCCVHRVASFTDTPRSDDNLRCLLTLLSVCTPGGGLGHPLWDDGHVALTSFIQLQLLLTLTVTHDRQTWKTNMNISVKFNRKLLIKILLNWTFELS